MFKKIAAVFLGAILLSGCFGSGSNQTKTEFSDSIIHPDWPTPIEKREIVWKVEVITEKGKKVPRTYLGYDDQIELQLFNNDVSRYMNELTKTLCFYRASLKEERCALPPVPLVKP